MIKVINTIKFLYRGKLELDNDTNNKMLELQCI